MAALGELVVKLSANIAEFTGAMDKAAWQSQKRMDEMAKVAERAGAAIGVALAAGAASLAATVSRMVDGADELGKAANKVGVTTEALSALRYAAELSGVSAETLQSSMNKLNKSIADGNPAFVALGISVESADGRLKSADQVLLDMAARFGQMDDGAQKSALAMEILGKSGAELVPLLNAGRDGIKEMTDEAAQFGLVVSRDVADAAAAYNDNLTRIQKTQEGLAMQLTAQLLPTMEQLSKEAVAVARDFDLVTPVAKATTVLFQTLAVVGSDVAFVFKMAGNEIGGMAAQLAALASGDFRGFSAIGEMMKADAAAARAELDAFQTRIMAIGTTAVEVAQKAAAADSGGGPFGPVIRSAKAAKTAVDAAVKAQQDLQREAQRVFEATRTPAEQLASEYDRLNRLLDAGAISWDTYGRAVMAAQEKLMPMAAEAEKAEKQIAQIEKTTGGVERVISNAFGNMGDALAEFAMGGKVSFSDLVNTMIKDLIRFQAQAAMTAMFSGGSGGGGLVGSLVSGLTGWAGAASGATYGTSAGSQQSMMLASQDFGLRANGGMVQAGQSYLVGERGPELLTLGSVSGNITPNSALGGGGNVTVNVINNGDSPARAEKRSDGKGGSIIDVIVERAKNAVAADIGSGNGAVPAAMQGAYGLNRRAGAY